jgi:F-type H+-transporting ATPase subunit gamma
MERLRARLDNIQAVEPILSALRTISSGTRMAALKKMESAERYQQGLARVVSLVRHPLSAGSRPSRGRRTTMSSLPLLAVGSERGLCGGFNEAMAAYADQVRQELTTDDTHVELWVLGARAERALRSLGIEPAWSGRLSLTAVPPPSLAEGLVSGWLSAYATGEIVGVEIVYNAYRGLGPYQLSRMQLLPSELPVLAEAERGLPPIVETDHQRLFWHATRLWLSARLHTVLLDSAAAEHTARYQLMDGAAENAQRLIEELKLFLQLARQEAITSEMRDLASGAGLLTQSSSSS